MLLQRGENLDESVLGERFGFRGRGAHFSVEESRFPETNSHSSTLERHYLDALVHTKSKYSIESRE